MIIETNLQKLWEHKLQFRMAAVWVIRTSERNYTYCIKKNLNRLILAQINTSSTKNRCDQLGTGRKGNVNLLMILKTKLDDSFPPR